MRCFICLAPFVSSVGMCRTCGKAYNRAQRAADGTLLSTYQWIAERARRMERKRLATKGAK